MTKSKLPAMLDTQTWTSPDTGIEMKIRPIGRTILTDLYKNVKKEMGDSEPAIPKVRFDDGYEHEVETEEYIAARDLWLKKVSREATERATPFFIEYGVVDILLTGWEEIAKERKAEMEKFVSDLDMSEKFFFVARVAILTEPTLQELLSKLEGDTTVEEEIEKFPDTENG